MLIKGEWRYILLSIGKNLKINLGSESQIAFHPFLSAHYVIIKAFNLTQDYLDNYELSIQNPAAHWKLKIYGEH